jgi:hypothetical protein
MIFDAEIPGASGEEQLASEITKQGAPYCKNRPTSRGDSQKHDDSMDVWLGFRQAVRLPIRLI